VREGAGDFGGMIDPHLVQRDLGTIEGLGQRQPEMLHHRFGDLPADAQRRIERRERVLKHRADPPPEHLPPLRRRKTSDILPFEQHRAGDLRGGAEEVQDRAGDAALAGSGLADDGERPAAPQRKADVACSGDLAIIFAIADRQIADFEQRFGGRRR
jgi:hypothetical protein